MADAGSSLLLDEYFEAGDERFLDEVLRSAAGGKLKALAPRWQSDSRPFARKALLAYVDDGCDRRGHRPLVKALFKAAESAHDVELLGHLLVAFDRLRKRELVKRSGYDWQTRSVTETFALQEDLSVPLRARRPKKSAGGKEGFRQYLELPRFSRVTRGYLQRRAWRYFRKLGHKDPVAYGKAIRAALELYEDEKLSKPERLIDAWGLMHALYYASPVLQRNPNGITVADGRTLAQLQPAPFCPEAWRNCREELFRLVLHARSRTVRTFAIGRLKADYADALRGMPVAELQRLLRATYEEVQLFGVELLRSASGLDTLPIKEWLELLSIENPLALAVVCELVEKTVAPDRLSLEQCLRLAVMRAAPVAELGLKWAKQKRIASVDDLRFVVRLAHAEAPNVRKDAMEWVAQLLVVADDPKPELVRELIDSKHEDVRAKGLELLSRDKRFGENASLWMAMAENPYADVRDVLVRNLERLVADAKGALTPPSPEGRGLVAHVWASSILAVARGGKTRRVVANQIADRIAEKPSEADALLPLLGFALRSIRPSEQRTALAALSRAAFERPSLQAAIVEKLPELKFLGEEVTR